MMNLIFKFFNLFIIFIFQVHVQDHQFQPPSFLIFLYCNLRGVTNYIHTKISTRYQYLIFLNAPVSQNFKKKKNLSTEDLIGETS